MTGRRALGRVGVTVLGWGVALALFFPITVMVLTGFKTEEAAIGGRLFDFAPTLATYAAMLDAVDFSGFAVNSVVIAIAATVLCLAFGIPAAYAMAFHPTKRTRGVLLWMLSTKMLPPVGVLIPIFLVFRAADLLDTQVGLITLYTLMNLPVVVWMLFTFFKDIPREILEAGRMDGARMIDEIRYLLLPLALPGIASASLLSVVLCWNEGFWSLNLTSVDAAPLTVLIASFASPEGLFFAKLSAASTAAVVPIVFLGGLGMRQMVRGLTFGAIK